MSLADSPLALAEADAQAQLPSHVIVECPSHWALEVQVLDRDGVPAPGIPVELRQNSREALRSKTTRNGVVRFEGLLEQSYAISLYTLAAEGWRLVESLALDEPHSRSGPARWSQLGLSGTPAREHLVQEGECVAGLAQRFGLLAETLWAANAHLHASRPSPNLLVPGDRLRIPAIAPRSESGASGKRHIVQTTGANASLRIQFLDWRGDPREGVPYLVEFQAPSPIESATGLTDSGGWVEEVIPPDLPSARITLDGWDGPEEYLVRVSHLEPVATLRGVQARLSNLGFGSAEEDGEAGPRTAAALSRFQAEHGLPVTGEPDVATRAELRSVHGC